MTERRLVSSGSYLEPVIGFSRAVRVGDHIVIGGTAPIRAEGGTAGIGDVYAQTRRCLEIVEKALNDAGGRLEHVTRTPSSSPISGCGRTLPGPTPKRSGPFAR